MNYAEVELPSNRKFGFFFTFILLVAAGYFYVNSSATTAYVFVALSLAFLVVTLVIDSILLPLNMLWIRFGILLGTIIAPIVLGLIFFAIFTPIAFLMRLFRRDELRLKFKMKSTHWIKRETPLQTHLFKNQF